MRVRWQSIDKILTFFMYACIIYIFLFYILKTLGYIHTHPLVHVSPLIACAFTVCVFVAKVMRFVELLRPLPDRVARMAQGLTKLEIRFDILEKEMTKMGSRLGNVESGFSRVASTTEKLGKKLSLLSTCKNYSV